MKIPAVIISMMLLAPAYLIVKSPMAAQVQSTQTESKPNLTNLDNPTHTVRKTVAFLRTVYQRSDGSLGVNQGTCFFVGMSDPRLGKNGSFVYIVTNRHVVEPESVEGQRLQTQSTHLLLNVRATSTAPQLTDVQLPRDNINHWYFPSDEAVDLAVFPFAPDTSVFDYLTIPSSILEAKTEMLSHAISEGDKLMYSGFFAPLPGQKRIQPIVREGTLAMFPDEPVKTTLNGPGELYLGDLQVIPGSSGSPVFVDIGGTRNGAMKFGSDYRLLGIVSGFFYEDRELNLRVATLLSANFKNNVGVAAIVPAEELKKLLGSPQLEHVRDLGIPGAPASP